MLKGNLAQFPVTQLLRDLHTRGDTGVLSLSNDATTKRVFFKRGSIVFASSTAADERLGERLVQAGKLKRTELDLACRVRESSRLRLGETLVDMGYLTHSELDERLREQVEHIVRSVLPWDAGDFQTELKANAVDSDLERFDISTLNLLLDGVRGIDSLSLIRQGIGSLERPLRYAADPKTLDQSLKLTPEEGFVLSRVDDRASAGEIARLSPMGEEQTLRCLWALVAVGILEVEPARSRTSDLTPPSRQALAFRQEMLERQRRAESMTLYELLGIPPGAATEDIKAAYFRLAKTLHPDHRAGPSSRGAEDADLDDLYLKVQGAYEVLSDEAARARYDSRLEGQRPGGEVASRPANESRTSGRSLSAEQLAKLHFANGERYFDEGRYHEAIEELRSAIRLGGSKAPYHRLLARALSKNPKWRKHAEEQYLKALALDRLDGRCYFELGELYESSGLWTRARKMFEEAVALDPDNLRALHKLAAHRGGSATLAKKRELLEREPES